MTLEDIQTNAAVRGIIPDALVTVVSVQWFDSEALELTYKTPSGKVASNSSTSTTASTTRYGGTTSGGPPTGSRPWT